MCTRTFPQGLLLVGVLSLSVAAVFEGGAQQEIQCRSNSNSSNSNSHSDSNSNVNIHHKSKHSSTTPMLAIIHLVSLLLASSLVSAGILAFPQPPSQNKPIPGDSPLLKCDAGEAQLLDLHNVNLIPNPPQRGENLTIGASGHLLKTVVEGAYVDVEVRLGYIKLLSQTYDLCQELEDNDIGGLSCPLLPGEYNLEKIVQIPNEVPPGKYSVIARAYTVEDDEITCLTGDVIFPAY